MSFRPKAARDGLGTRPSEFEPCGFFVLRAPLLSVQGWQRWSDAGDLDRQRAAMRAQLERPEVREAIAVASPSLLEGLPQWIRDPDSEGGQKVERALVRYLSRMSTRPTPFGLFAGCGVGTIGARTRIRVGPSTAHRRRTRLDNDYLDQLARRVSKSPELRHALRYRPNSSLYEGGGKMRYVVPRFSANGRTFDLAVLDPNEYLDVALLIARAGATAIEIAQAIADHDPEVTHADALGFVDGLVDAYVLVSELEPTVTGREPIHDMIESLAPIAPAAALVETLKDVQGTLASIDGERALRPNDAHYTAMAQTLAQLCEGADTRRLLQVDMQLGLDEATLDGGVVAELVEAAELLAQVRPQGDEQLLRNFCQRFEARYERREVPLLEALDEDCGIGFGKLRAEGNDPEPLLAGVHIGSPQGSGSGRAWGAFEEMLKRKLEAAGTGARELELERSDFAGLPKRQLSLPDSCSLVVTFAANDADAMADGDYRALLHLVDGPSCANWLGRFCHADPELQGWVERALRAEEARHPDAVFAEIVHLPEGRVGNVLLRPVMREYEIPYLGRSGADADRQISLDDLVVTVWDGRIVLKSKRLQREVIPRLSTAHNFGSFANLGVYRFLCALQTVGRSVRTSWSWGAVEHCATFLPRVTIGRVVLSLARWNLRTQHIAPIDAATTEARWAAMQALRTELALPRFVCVADADNLLSIDFENPLVVESAAQLLRKRPSATLLEMFPEPSTAWVESPQGVLSHEMIIPIARKPAAAVTTNAAPTPWLRPAPARDVPRVFVPGSEWLYVKLYASPRSCDMALLQLAPLLRELVGAGVVTKWFFLRFSDEVGWHLRLRLHGAPERMPIEALGRIRAVVEPMIADGQVWKMQLDSYHREVEHWGGPEGVLLAEQFLAHDSAAVLEILEAYADEPTVLAEARWQLTLRGIDGLWRGLGLDDRARFDQATSCRAGFAQEFGVGAAQEQQLSLRFRGVRKDIERVLGAESPWAAGEQALQRRDTALVEVFEGMRALDRSGVLIRPLHTLAERFSHLHVNRMLRSMLREQELVAVDLLARHYRSTIARSKPKA